MKNPLEDKVILLTGGTGSFGQAFARIALLYNPKAIRIYSRGEYLQYKMQQEFNNPRLRFFIGDVRDRERLSRAVTDCDIVIHAAALKQIVTCEYNPIEAVKTNISGSINIVDCALDHDIERVIAISSDKAVSPTNLYGATKMVMEKLIVQANYYTGRTGRTKFSCVRYGNVIGSRGSVINKFLEQRETGTLTITDEQMTRFWLTADDGVDLIIKALDVMQGGEIFVPKVVSLKVQDWAEILAPEADIITTGIRPGEKIHETLITEDEGRRTKEFDNYYVIEPELLDFQSLGVAVGEGFEYKST